MDNALSCAPLVSARADCTARSRCAEESEREERHMMTRAKLYWSVSAIGMMLGLGAAPTLLSAQQNVPPGITVGSNDLGGVVRGPNGPEAGVWVIAETSDL